MNEKTFIYRRRASANPDPLWAAEQGVRRRRRPINMAWGRPEKNIDPDTGSDGFSGHVHLLTQKKASISIENLDLRETCEARLYTFAFIGNPVEIPRRHWARPSGPIALI